MMNNKHAHAVAESARTIEMKKRYIEVVNGIDDQSSLVDKLKQLLWDKHCNEKNQNLSMAEYCQWQIDTVDKRLDSLVLSSLRRTAPTQ